ncbi:sodium/proline symporter (proline permease) [Pseudescherichia vulneris]|nr:sodium/proline symporter (proline permease) [Pseudescherichia vulneris]
MAMSTPMLVTFLIYIFGMILIGFVAWRSTKNFDDYILGGRSLGPMVTALSAGASDMSGWLLMGLPGAIFISGISESWIAIGLTLGAWINWKLVAGRLRVHTEVNNNALTLPDYFTGRFEDRSRVLRIISALVILLFFTIYCASGIVAGARLFESTFGMSYETALWAGAAAHHPLYLRGRLPGCKLDRHRAGQPDDLCPDPHSGDGDGLRRRFRRLADGDQAEEH